jgi:predicted ATPase/class 3 adenylate cyclase/DNA-binding CsgD family transcriptional regulator
VVTFLLTDVAGSTRVWTAGGPEAASAMARQAEIIATAVAAHGGIRPLEQGEGDSMVAVFERASDALAAAVDAQLGLRTEPWADEAVAVRMALHTGEAEFRDEQTYGGAAIIRCARLRDHAQGGQVLVSAATAELTADRLPPGASLVPVGEVTLRGLSRAERVHQLVHEALPAPVADLGRRGNRLGVWPTPLIGRARERQDVGALLENARLVTMTGAGGAGKTRLAHAVATDLCRRFDPVVWVELARIASDADVATAVAHACGAGEVPGVEAVDVLAGFLQAKDVLVVLDNCEHLLDGCAGLVDKMLRRTPQTRVLATSREPLGVSGEVTWRIPSLEVPPVRPLDAHSVARCDAVELFVDRARAADPTFVLDDRTAGDVAAVCRRLDGLPLAIELAAARLRSMTLRAVTDGLDDRFRLLTGGARTGLARQQTLLASVEWSYALLDDDEQQLLRRLAVFVGPFTVEAAEAIAAEGGADRLAVFDTVSRLVDKSLAQRAGDRYSLLETIRQFALEQAHQNGELSELRDAHLRWFTSRAGRWAVAREILTETTTAEISAEASDLLGALDWSLRIGSEPALDLLWPLGRLWVAESRFAEASRVSEAVLDRFEPGSVGWLHALAPLARALTMGGDRSWIAPTEAALSELGDNVTEMARSHLEWASLTGPTVFRAPDRLTRYRSLMERGRRHDNPALEYGAAADLAYALAARGSLDEAERLCDWLDRRLLHDATLDVARGYLAFSRCQFEKAWRCVSHQARRRPADLPCTALAGLIGAYTEDRTMLTVGLEAYEWTGSLGAYGIWREVLRAFMSILDGRLDEARALLESVKVSSGLENQSPAFERLRVQLALAEGDVDTAVMRSRALQPLLDGPAVQPYPEASLHLLVADVATHLDELRDAEEAVHRALTIAAADLPIVAVDALELLAVLVARRNRAADAGRLLGATEAFRESTGLRFRFPLRKAQIDDLRPQLDAADLATGAGLPLADAVSVAQGTRGRRGRPSFGWDSLTPTELRVVELVSDGRSNAEIADKLFVGVATVKTHLVHVYEKLGLRSRTELAAAAARRETPC